ncbi:hypothetical protein EC957_001904 [Mortierella hygrophila]|uniref:Uncharacterized protein n=1 Tax=Mortierella hygrophila TaxID=979708 RepID=A0A9P6K2A3_9FUNG|nr:hypothetical protein EC957_001904 [Mortierella hygrophila]
MPLVHTQPFEKQDQEEAVPSALQQSQPPPPQPSFYRLLQRPRQLRQQQQQRKQALALESDDQDRPIDEPPPDPRLISQRLLQWQEQQQHRKRQEEQRQMQAFRIKKFSDSNTDLDYRPVATTITALKEGFQEYWGGPIVEHQQEELEDGQQHSRHSSIQQNDRDVDLAGSNDENGNNNLWEERRRRQRQLAQEHDMMETDSVMETDRTGDGDGDEEMSPQTKLQRARKAKEDAMKEYQEAGRNLQRAQEREEAILFENEMIEVEVGSSVSQQLHRCQGGHTHGHEQHRQLLSSPPVQLPQRQQLLEEQGRHSSPTTAAAAVAAAVTYLTQHDNNIETMMSSQIVPQVNDTPSIMSETPHTVVAPTPLLPVSAPSGSAPRRALTPMTNITTTTTGNQVPNQTRSGSQAWSRSLSVTNNVIQSPPTSPQTRRHSNSPRIRIKSEELDEPLFKKQVLNGDGATGPDGDSKRWQGPKYKDYDVSIVIPSSVGSSDVGMSGHPESSNAQERREQARKSERRLPDKWRSPTPMPGSMHAKREATTSRQQGIFWESTRPPLRFGPGVGKVAPVDLFGARSGQGQGQSRSSPMMAPPANQSASATSASASTTAPAFTGPEPAAPTPRYFNPPLHPHWRLPEFMDENGHPHPSVIFYTHIDRVDNFYHQHYPASTASRSRDVSLSPRSARNSPNFFARRSEGERMEDVSGGEGHEDMAMDGESHHHQRQGRSRTTSRQADRDERREEDRRERRPLAKSESPQP